MISAHARFLQIDLYQDNVRKARCQIFMNGSSCKARQYLKKCQSHPFDFVDLIFTADLILLRSIPFVILVTTTLQRKNPCSHLRARIFSPSIFRDRLVFNDYRRDRRGGHCHVVRHSGDRRHDDCCNSGVRGPDSRVARNHGLLVASHRGLTATRVCLAPNEAVDIGIRDVPGPSYLVARRVDHPTSSNSPVPRYSPLWAAEHVHNAVAAVASLW